MQETKSNFSLRHFVISSPALDEPVPLTMNHVLYLKYTEDIRSASVRLEAQITDSDVGIVSTLLYCIACKRTYFMTSHLCCCADYCGCKSCILNGSKIECSFITTQSHIITKAFCVSVRDSSWDKSILRSRSFMLAC